MVAKFFLDLVSLGARFTARAPRCRGPEADLGTLSSFKANSKPRAGLGGGSRGTAPKVTKTRFSHRGFGAAGRVFAIRLKLRERVVHDKGKQKKAKRRVNSRVLCH